MEQPCLIDYRIASHTNGQDPGMLSNEGGDGPIRRSERIKHFVHLRALRHGSDTDEDLKNDSETLSANGCLYVILNRRKLEPRGFFFFLQII